MRPTANLLLCVVVMSLIPQVRAAEDDRMTLWYDQPAKICMNDALPIGNGRLGAMIFGDTAAEQVSLTTKTAFGRVTKIPAEITAKTSAHTNCSASCTSRCRAMSMSSDIAARSISATRHQRTVSYELNGMRFDRENVRESHPAHVLDAARFTCEGRGSTPAASNSSMDMARAFKSIACDSHAPVLYPMA